MVEVVANPITTKPTSEERSAKGHRSANLRAVPDQATAATEPEIEAASARHCRERVMRPSCRPGTFGDPL